MSRLRLSVESLAGPAIVDTVSSAVEVLTNRLPGISSVIVTGSCARGDAMVDNGSLVSDLDLLVVVRASRAIGTYRELASASQEVSRKVGTKVTIAPLVAEALRHAPPTSFYYELREQALTVAGEHLLHKIPTTHGSQIRPIDALDVQFNYLMELLHHMINGNSGHPHSMRQASRAVLSVSDAALMLAGEYRGSLEFRVQAGLTALSRVLPELIDKHPEAPEVIQDAMAIRIGQPGSLDSGTRGQVYLSLLRASLDATANVLSARDGGVEEYNPRRKAFARNVQYAALRVLAQSPGVPGVGRQVTEVQLSAYRLAMSLLTNAHPKLQPVDSARFKALQREWPLACPVVGFV